ncbi:ricin-type beta-trefoil lectin domain protein [Streptomyces sp. HU2014]|uniref:ricin-type beta-trefoil lectin domain protein n=1 Tax=Streptomyces sp. HU2014 TaxID=2939414 RepID=UPI002010449E|nr:ricin-type beta-trefoil lectin domain protein [Streptomyces sp. HU2014]UQI45188.1 ricin-type beta-trefoil lectin domain protein [Streptomyces sp. HU2014]
MTITAVRPAARFALLACTTLALGFGGALPAQAAPAGPTTATRAAAADDEVNITQGQPGWGLDQRLRDLHQQNRSKSRGDYVGSLINGLGPALNGHYNLLVTVSDARFTHDLTGFKFRALVRKSNGVYYNVWVFDSGTFRLQSDGGWANWGLYGRWDQSDGNLTFHRASGGEIRGKDGKCLDIANSRAENGTAVQTYDCNNSNAQWWRHEGSALRAGDLGNWCLDAAGAATGAQAQLWACNGTPPQQWAYEQGQLRNAQWGYCLDVPNGNTANGSRLQMYQCNGTDSQRFTIPGD